MGNFNIKNSDWDPSFPHHFMYANLLLEITEFFDLELSSFIIQVSMRYVDNPNDVNSVISLIFLRSSSDEFNSHFIFSDLRFLLDHALLIVEITIQ